MDCQGSRHRKGFRNHVKDLHQLGPPHPRRIQKPREEEPTYIAGRHRKGLPHYQPWIRHDCPLQEWAEQFLAHEASTIIAAWRASADPLAHVASAWFPRATRIPRFCTIQNPAPPLNPGASLGPGLGSISPRIGALALVCVAGSPWRFFFSRAQHPWFVSYMGRQLAEKAQFTAMLRFGLWSSSP